MYVLVLNYELWICICSLKLKLYASQVIDGTLDMNEDGIFVKYLDQRNMDVFMVME